MIIFTCVPTYCNLLELNNTHLLMLSYLNNEYLNAKIFVVGWTNEEKMT